MSRENVEVVKEIWDAFMRGDFPAEAFSEAVEWHVASDVPESGPGSEPLRGAEQIRQMLAGSWETVDEPWLRTDELRDCDSTVVVRWRGGGTGRV